VDKPSLSSAGAGDSFAGCDQSDSGAATRARSWAVVSGAVLVPAAGCFGRAAATGGVTVVAATASEAGSAAASGSFSKS
jgi:hypothetical protein